jgi:uncharacterized membrane protein
MSAIVLLHVSTATVGLLSGALAMLFRKGSSLHRIAGNIFFPAMLLMSGSGAFAATFLKPNGGNVMGGLLTFYLVATAWVAARRRDHETGLFDWGALLVALTIVGCGAVWGVEAARSATGLKAGYPPALYFLFGTIALLFALADVRMLRAGGVSGARRIARHLWRMCLALLIALLSFYPGQSRLFPASIRGSSLAFVPHILLVGSAVYWMFRIRAKRAAATTLVPVRSEP